MTAAQYFLLLSSIYLSPRVSAELANAGALLCLVIAVLLTVFDR